MEYIILVLFLISILFNIFLYSLIDDVHTKVKNQEKNITELKIKAEQLFHKQLSNEATYSSSLYKLNDRFNYIEDYLTKPGN